MSILNLKRDDTEVALFGLSLGGAAMFGAMRAGQPFADALWSGAAVATGAAAVIYGTGLLTRSLPTAAATVLEFRQTLRAPATAPRFRLVSQADEAQPAGAPLDRVQRWRMGLRQFLLAARFAGSMSLGEMVKTGMVTDTAWRKFTGALKDNGILAASKAGTDYAQGWNYGRACFVLRHDPLTLPEGEPPTINF